MKTLITRLLLLGFVASLSLPACVGVRFDGVALSNVTSIRNDLPTVLSTAATKPYKDAEKDVTKVLDKIEKGYSHAQATKKNQDVAEQWRLLRDEMVQPFVTRWKEKGKLDKDFVGPAVKQVQDALAAIERTERAKRGAPKDKVITAEQ
jgi:hypothetical protein